MLENPDYEIPESLGLIIKKVLSLSRNTTDGEMIHNLIVLLLVISAYTTEPKASSLATSIFNSWSANRNDTEAFFTLLEPCLDHLYHNELELSFKMSSWKIAKAFKAVLKWLIDSMDKFSHAEVKFDTLLGLYTNLKVNFSLAKSFYRVRSSQMIARKMRIRRKP